MTRAVWEYEPAGSKFMVPYQSGKLTVTTTAEHVLVELEDEVAVDSYNQTCELSMIVPFDKVDELIAHLVAARSAKA
jgi:hypothetical protein